MKQTNETRAMVGALVRGMLPSSWRRYAVARGCTVQQWVGDFAHRVTQLAAVSDAVSAQGAKRLQVTSLTLLSNSRVEEQILLDIWLVRN